MAALAVVALLLWLLGAVLFLAAADFVAERCPERPTSAEWRRAGLCVQTIVCLLWWLLVLWQLADEAKKRWG